MGKHNQLKSFSTLIIIGGVLIPFKKGAPFHRANERRHCGPRETLIVKEMGAVKAHSFPKPLRMCSTSVSTMKNMHWRGSKELL